MGVLVYSECVCVCVLLVINLSCPIISLINICINVLLIQCVMIQWVCLLLFFDVGKEQTVLIL